MSLADPNRVTEAAGCGPADKQHNVYDEKRQAPARTDRGDRLNDGRDGEQDHAETLPEKSGVRAFLVTDVPQIGSLQHGAENGSEDNGQPQCGPRVPNLIFVIPFRGGIGGHRLAPYKKTPSFYLSQSGLSHLRNENFVSYHL